MCLITTNRPCRSGVLPDFNAPSSLIGHERGSAFRLPYRPINVIRDFTVSIP